MKNLLKISLILGVIFALSFTNGINKRVIVIDAGHGGQDIGTAREGISEKDIVLDIAKKIKNLNKNENIEIVLTRDGDIYPTLSDRTDLINKIKPEMTISLHMNSIAKNSDKKGSEIYFQDNEASKNLAQKLSETFDNCLTKNLNLHILKNSNTPTVVLELGYMSNIDDRNYLNSENGKQATAQKILDVITTK